MTFSELKDKLTYFGIPFVWAPQDKEVGHLDIINSEGVQIGRIYYYNGRIFLKFHKRRYTPYKFDESDFIMARYAYGMASGKTLSEAKYFEWVTKAETMREEDLLTKKNWRLGNPKQGRRHGLTGYNTEYLFYKIIREEIEKGGVYVKPSNSISN